MAKAKARLKKNPEIERFIVEETFEKGSGEAQMFSRFMLKSGAMAFAKTSLSKRVRAFELSFKQVYDSKAGK